MLSLILDTLTLIGDGNSTYVIEPIDGLDIPPTRLVRYDLGGADGAAIGAALYSSRVVSISGAVIGSNYLAGRRALEYASRLQRTGPRITLTPLKIVTSDGLHLTTYVALKSFQMAYKEPYAPFQIQLEAPDPLLYLDGTITSGQQSRPTSGGVKYNPTVTYPLIYGTTTGGIATVNNPGTADVKPVVYLRGAMTNPTFTSQDTGSTISLNIVTANPTDVIKVNMATHSVTLNDTSILYAKSSDSDWFSLVPGVNTIRFSTGLAGDTGTIEVTAAAAVLGI